MKRKLISLCTAVWLVIFSVFFFSCEKGEKGVQPVAIDLTGVAVEEGTTLLDIMQDLQEEGKLTFQLSNGMVTSINGRANSMTYNPCWMLYTSDDDPAVSNHAWGTYEYGEKTLSSAALGVDELLVKAGELYVWVYQSF